MARVHVSTVIPAPVEAVWRRVRDFGALPEWVPAVARSRIEDGRAADSVGCVRAFDLHGGEKLRERLLALSDHEHLCTYSILESHMPISNYVATLRLRRITDGDQTLGEWTADFDCAPEQERDLVETIGTEVFLPALRGLADAVG